MLSHQFLSGAKLHFRTVICKRNLGIFAPALQKATDPIQQLFVDKIREYKQKSGGGNKLADPTPEVKKEIENELEKIARQFGGGPGVDMTKFPSPKFTDPVIDSIHLETEKEKK